MYLVHMKSFNHSWLIILMFNLIMLIILVFSRRVLAEIRVPSFCIWFDAPLKSKWSNWEHIRNLPLFYNWQLFFYSVSCIGLFCSRMMNRGIIKKKLKKNQTILYFNFYLLDNSLKFSVYGLKKTGNPMSSFASASFRN